MSLASADVKCLSWFNSSGRSFHSGRVSCWSGSCLARSGFVLRKDSQPFWSSPLGKHQPSMGLLLTIITLTLYAIGLLILIQEQASKGETWLVLVVNKGVFIIQKVIQAAVYVWLRDFRVRKSCRQNARFYFEVLASFNFIDWLDTQTTLDISFDVGQAKKFHGEWFGSLYRIYKALLVDYRPLC